MNEGHEPFGVGESPPPGTPPHPRTGPSGEGAGASPYAAPPHDPSRSAPLHPGAYPAAGSEATAACSWAAHTDLKVTAGPTPHSAVTGPDLAVLDGRWNPEEELARLLSTSAGPATGAPAGGHGLGEGPAGGPGPSVAGARTRPPAGHRRPRLRRHPFLATKVLSLLLSSLVALLVAVVSLLCAVVAYDPLSYLAAPGRSSDVANYWPLLIYGPWLVGSFSVLRAALFRRRAVQGWLTVVLFSLVAASLCVAQAEVSLTGCLVAGLPPVAALACFHQLVRQITLTRPPRREAPHRHRRAAPRH